MKKSQPIITLTCDFGDDFACSQLELVVHSLNPNIKFITTSKEVTPYSIIEGSFIISQVYKISPRGSIHIGVVDPGVGSERRGIAIQTKNYWFVGPDNGLLLKAAVEDGIKQVFAINSQKVNPRSCVTFHGRDIFAHTAGLISLKKSLINFTTKVELETLVKLPDKKGEIVHIDPYGNIKLNYKPNGFKYGDKLNIKVGNKKLALPYCKTFADVKPGGFLIYAGSHQTLEIAQNLGSAASKLKLKVGDSLILS